MRVPSTMRAGAAVGGQPALQALRRRHAAVQRDHGVVAVERGKARREAGFELRREVDLGHHHHGLGVGRAQQQLLDAAQIDLGLAATGGAEQQKRPRFLLKPGDHRRLFPGEGDGCGCASVFGQVRRSTFGGVAFEPSSQLQGVEVAQLGRQGRQRHFAR
jgi:hypothetical protein